MIRLIPHGAWLLRGNTLLEEPERPDLAAIQRCLNAHGLPPLTAEEAARVPHGGKMLRGRIADGIMARHTRETEPDTLALRFDALGTHDLTYVGILQSAMASGMKEFPVPCVITNCHNSLCAVGGTINEDDHVFGLSAARRFGGEYVPPHIAVLHQYMREMYAGCGKMILGSDSHTRYGALGTLAVGEGGPELVKHMVGRTYDMPYPDVVGIFLTGKLRAGVGPQDVALALIGAVFKNAFVKNSVMEFIGPGVAALSMDFRMGIDVMTTETACWSSIWQTDGKVREFLAAHARPHDFHELVPAPLVWYDRLVTVDLDKIRPMIALPFHPSNAYAIEDFNADASDILRQTEKEGKREIGPLVDLRIAEKMEKGRLRVDQGIIAGCSGGLFENIVAASRILDGQSIGNGKFSLSIYPASQPVNVALLQSGCLEKLLCAGAVIREAFCGPCFGAGDTPANGAFSIRHTTRNFPHREGAKPGEGQFACVALMDARSIAATAANGGLLTAAEGPEQDACALPYLFHKEIYEKRVYRGFGKPDPGESLVYGPNIKPWPEIPSLPENLLLLVASVIHDPVTTTDELIPSGETSSLRSNPLRLAEFTLSRKDPSYVRQAKSAQELDRARRAGEQTAALADALALAGDAQAARNTGLGSAIFAVKPGDGSAREQAASSQRVLGGAANLVLEYATKRYRSNLINWGILPFVLDPADKDGIQVGDWLHLPGVRAALQAGETEVRARLIRKAGEAKELRLRLPGLSAEDRDILLAGCLMNYYATR